MNTILATQPTRADLTVDEALQFANDRHQAGDVRTAAEVYQQILRSHPDHVRTLISMGLIARQKGSSTTALELFRRALDLNPQESEVHDALGELWYGQGMLDEAIACYRRALELNPQRVDSLTDLASCLRLCGELTAAVPLYQRAVQLQPDFSVAHSNLGETLLLLGRLDESASSHRRAIQLRPDVAEFHNSLAVALKELGRLDEAICCCRRAIELKPNFSKPYTNLGLALMDQARGDESIACYRRALQLDPTDRVAGSGLLFARNYFPGNDPHVVRAEQRQWNDTHAAPLSQDIPPHTDDRRTERPLRIGYVSPNFRGHCQSLFTTPLLSAHDHEQFEVYCYSDVVNPDATTERLRGYADHWRPVHRLSDEQLANTIREDRIDVLVDLTMHMAGNRLLTFARKPAPVQVCWLAYPGTTGMAAMDYRLSDPSLDPPGQHDQLYSEQTMRLPDTFWCYAPLESSPPVSALPAASGCGITFGCLNNFYKVSDLALRMWAAVLKEVVGSRIVILSGGGSHRQRVLRTFASAGVHADRVDFVPRQAPADYLRLFHQIDITLDPAPTNGHTTSLDSFWMGVPVVSLVGRTAPGRAGLSQLTNLGLPELIAHTPEQYVRIAAELARDLPRLIELRGTLRDRMQLSPLMDAPRFAGNMEAVYRQMWKRWCSGGQP
ncbi:TPR repeat-containing protein YrrB [Stieleria neptunia]|uniref:protein O-GlcNAc transferase n=1 Tax=Stieleria neptunia TaxID=2527979 RepID=A0A518I2W7_9BACT|nr:tetratricopeptide repeat protein [Stieleria neptunia]QDV47459.1 TPR repeat-containing protein YrrB [Stieleria neptunia]